MSLPPTVCYDYPCGQKICDYIANSQVSRLKNDLLLQNDDLLLKNDGAVLYKSQSGDSSGSAVGQGGGLVSCTMGVCGLAW